MSKNHGIYEKYTFREFASDVFQYTAWGIFGTLVPFAVLLALIFVFSIIL